MSARRMKFLPDPMFADPIPDCPALTSGETVDGWRVVEPVGKGGFGMVFKVRKKGVEGALKICSVNAETGAKPDDVQWRYEQEIEILEAVDGKFAPRLYGKGVHNGAPYFIMEYLEPVKPSAMPKSDASITAMMRDLTYAIGELHKQGWVHCDIKPHNIARRADGKYLLIDFGSAHRMDPEGATEHRFDEYSRNYQGSRYVVAGTKYYEPPELCFRPCRDVYALGHVLRDCFAKDVPFEWSMIINKCISWRQEYRYPDVDELRHDIVHLDEIKQATYCVLRNQVIKEQRATERTLLGAAQRRPIAVDWDEILSKDDERSSCGLTVFTIKLKLGSAAFLKAKGPLELPPNTLVIVDGPGILKADIRGPSSSVVVLRQYASLNNTSRLFPPENSLLYALVGPGSYLNFPNIKERDRPKFFDKNKRRRRIFRDMDATTAFRFGGPKAFSNVENQTITGLEQSDLPKGFLKQLIAFFKGESSLDFQRPGRANGSARHSQSTRKN